MTNMLFNSGMQNLDKTSELTTFVAHFDLNRQLVESPIQETFSSQLHQNPQAVGIRSNESESNNARENPNFIALSGFRDEQNHPSEDSNYPIHLDAFIRPNNTKNITPSSSANNNSRSNNSNNTHCFSTLTFPHQFQMVSDSMHPMSSNLAPSAIFTSSPSKSSSTHSSTSSEFRPSSSSTSSSTSSFVVSPTTSTFSQESIYPLPEFGHTSFSVDYGVLDLMAGNELVCELSHSPQEWNLVSNEIQTKRFRPTKYLQSEYPVPFLESPPFVQGYPTMIHKDTFADTDLLRTSPFLSPFTDSNPNYAHPTYSATLLSSDGIAKDHIQERNANCTDLFAFSDTHATPSSSLPDTPTSMYSFEEHPSMGPYMASILPNATTVSNVVGGQALEQPTLLVPGTSMDIPTPPTSPHRYTPNFPHPMYVVPSVWMASSQQEKKEPPNPEPPASTFYTPALFPASLICPDTTLSSSSKPSSNQFHQKQQSKLLALLENNPTFHPTSLESVDHAMTWIPPSSSSATFPFSFSSSLEESSGLSSSEMLISKSGTKKTGSKRTSSHRLGTWMEEQQESKKKGMKKEDPVSRTVSMKMYSCARCEKSFKRKADCIRHGRIHTGEKPYKCPGCSESFARQDALRRHQGKGNVKCANALKQYITVNSIAESPEAASLVKHGNLETLAKKWLQTESSQEIPLFL